MDAVQVLRDYEWLEEWCDAVIKTLARLEGQEKGSWYTNEISLSDDGEFIHIGYEWSYGSCGSDYYGEKVPVGVFNEHLAVRGDEAFTGLASWIKQQRDEKKVRKAEERKAETKRQAAAAKAAQEKYDREEYERLKKKFEG
jgi:hypothetical protein